MTNTPIAQTVEQVIRVMRHMAYRMTWEGASAALRAAGLHVSRGWDDTIDAFVQSPMKPGTAENALRVLLERISTHIHVGNKQVTWYDLKQLDPKDADSVRKWANAVDLATLEPAEPFSILDVPISAGSLGTLLKEKSRLVAVERRDGRLYFTYFAVRAYTVREEVNISALDDVQRAPFQEYSEVIGVKPVCLPCFDVAVIDPSADRIEIRTDASIHSVRADVQAAATHTVVEDVNRHIFKALTISPVGLGLVNFFPAVNKFYKNKNAGNVGMLGFVATSLDTSSNNRGQIHRRRDQDLRKDKFHTGGAGNVNKINPYAIGIIWPQTPESLQLELNGNVRMLNKGAPWISEAEFRGCSTYADFEFITAELAQHLKP